MQTQIMLQQKKKKKTTKFLAVLGLCLTLAVCLCSSIAKTSVTPQQADVQVVQTMNAPVGTYPGYASLRLADSSTEVPAKKAASPILTEIIENLTGGITSTAQGIGTGINSAIKSIFIDTSTDGATSLSTAGIIITVFAGIALALGLTYLVVHFLFNLGGGRL